MPDCVDTFSPATGATPATGAHASLSLRFARDDCTTRLVGRRHAGPLRVQKALYPEGAAVCHAIVVHPPGGVVGGDTLAIAVEVQAGAHAVLCTPGAAKWYRANGRASAQRVQLTGAAGSVIEWLPQESILYDGADVRLEHVVDLAAGARYLGLDIVCFGRRASGESYRRGQFRQQTSIRLDGALVWWEQGRLAADSAAMGSAIGLAGFTVCATLLVVGPPLPAPLIAAVRALDGALGASQLKAVFVVRLLCDDSETARRLMLAAWQLLRPHIAGCAGVVPRIWRT